MFIGFAFACYTEGTDHTDACQNSCSSEEYHVGLLVSKQRKGNHYYQITCQCTNLTGRILYTESCSTASGFGIFQRQCVFHSKLNMFSK